MRFVARTTYIHGMGFLKSLFLIAAFSACVSPKPKMARVQPFFDKQGHRGCRGLLPENTIPAMLKAIDLGVTTLEMDAVITADSQVILSHEPFFNHEITTKADGTGVTEAEEQALNIYKMTYAQTQAFDVGLKPHARFRNQEKMAVTKPLLADVIARVEAYLKEKKLPRVAYNIETKCKWETDSLFHPEPQAFVRLVTDVIRSKGIESRTIIQSFDIRTLQVVHRQYRVLKTALLIEDYDKRTYAEQVAALGFQPAIYSPHYSLVNAALVQQCKKAGVQLIPWTVNEKEEIARLKAMGVDGIITDYPNLFAGL
jgi:glycerophosphoryl diester phosphodiesterase